MPPSETSPSRTLHEWHDYIVKERNHRQWKEAGWRTKQWWFRQRLSRMLRAKSARSVLNDWFEHLRSYGKPVKVITGKSIGHQFLEMTLLYFAHGIDVHSYYTYKLYRDSRFNRASDYIYHHPKIRLNDAIQGFTRDNETYNTRDKRSWFRWAAAHDVPSGRQLATFDSGEVELFDWDGLPTTLPEDDLFSIATNVYRGHGAHAWKWKGGQYVDAQTPSRHLNPGELITFLKQRSSEHPISLQVRMRNHSALQDFTNGALATFRLVTGGYPNTAPEPLIAVLKMPVADDIVDNGSNRVAASVHIASGRLGRAWYKYPRRDRDYETHHPDTTKRIEGRTLKFFPDICEVAVETHRKMSAIPFVGWDITYTTDGIRIVEPNEGWGAEGTEIPLGRPLSETDYAPMYDAWMRYLHEN